MTLMVFLVVGVGIQVCQAAPKKKAQPVVDPGQKDDAFRKMVAAFFSRCDADHDRTLTVPEIDAMVTDPAVRGSDAAIAVVFHRHLLRDDDEKTNGLAYADALTLAADPKIQHAISADAAHIQSVNRVVFLGNDPNLSAFHQGRMGDCYLLAVIGDYAFQHPQEVHNMIKSGPDGKFEVTFGNGKKVAVPLLTDAELIMGAVEGRTHGIWLSVLEKAFALLHKDAKEEKTGEEIPDDEAVTSDLIGRGGYYGPVIALFSGHKTAGAPVGRWLKQDPKSAADKMDELLTKLSSEHRLMAVGTGHDKTKALPRGIPHGHVLSLLEYFPASRTVRMFNPWGNNFKPNGPAGMVNGYPTQYGIFDMPLADFLRIFSGFTYESDKPVAK